MGTENQDQRQEAVPVTDKKGAVVVPTVAAAAKAPVVRRVGVAEPSGPVKPPVVEE